MPPSSTRNAGVESADIRLRARISSRGLCVTNDTLVRRLVSARHWPGLPCRKPKPKWAASPSRIPGRVIFVTPAGNWSHPGRNFVRSVGGARHGGGPLYDLSLHDHEMKTVSEAG